MALTSLATIKAFLNIPTTDTSKDAQLDALRAASEQAIKSYCGRDFEPTTYTQFYSGTGRRQIILRQIPVTSITSVFLDHNGNFGTTSGSFDSSTTLLTSGVDYALDLDGSWNSLPVSFSGLLYRIGTTWPETYRGYAPGKIAFEVGPAYGNIKVVFSAGYNPIPQDLQYAVCTLTSYMRLTGALGGFPLESEKIGDYAYRLHFPVRMTLETYPELGSTRQLLSRYREVSI